MTSPEKSPTVFIAWHAIRSREMGTALHKWLRMVIQAAEPWMSEHDLDSGIRWSPELAEKLDRCSFGIACLTPENLTSTWIHFESGAIAKSLREGRLVPYLLDLEPSQVVGPLAEFEMSKANREGTLALLQSLNGFLPSRPLEVATLQSVFDTMWPQLEGELARIREMPGAPPRRRETNEMLEEILNDVRALRRSADSVDTDNLIARRIANRKAVQMPRPEWEDPLDDIRRAMAVSNESMSAMRQAMEAHDQMRETLLAQARAIQESGSLLPKVPAKPKP